MDRRSILVLDDDQGFRDLLVRILSPLGFPVVEARSTKEALAIVARTELALAIVDFRLPETDGMTFITRLRDAGKDTPVVFVSGTWCDPKTFNWLRNILRVSLVLQKPIQPNLFLQQIEILLPADRQQPTLDGDLDYQDLLAAIAGMDRELTEEEEARFARLDPEHREQVQEMLAQIEAEKSIRAVQRELSVNLPPEWDRLSQTLRQLQHDLGNFELRQTASLLAHTLKGTAGSLGLMKVSEAASKIEGYAKLLDPDDDLGQEVIWLEIFRQLTEGQMELRALCAAEGEHVEETVPVGRVLLLGTEQRLHQYAHEMPTAIDAQITYTSAPVDAALKAAATRFDAAVLDVSRFGKQAIFNLAREMRMTDMNDALPLAFLLEPEDNITASERLFYGCSQTMTCPIDGGQLGDCLRKLALVNKSQAVKVLTVDDDPILTAYIEKVLSSHGMAVSTLNEPIRILDTLEQTHPDLILLDVIMPGLSGYDICRMLRASERWSDMPIVFLTSKSDAQGRTAAFQAGADDFLAKPIISDELLLRVKLQLQRARNERDRGGTDQITGLFSQEAFLSRGAELLAGTKTNVENLSLAVIQIADFDDLDAYGMFAKINVVATLGKLIQARFPAETLRGRLGESGFMLAFRGESARTATEAMAFLVDELEQINFIGEQGRSYTAGARVAAAECPQDGDSLDSLVQTASRRLLTPSAS